MAVRGYELDAYGGRVRNTVPCEARSLQPLGMKELAAFTWHTRPCEYINLDVRGAHRQHWQKPDMSTRYTPVAHSSRGDTDSEVDRTRCPPIRLLLGRDLFSGYIARCRQCLSRRTEGRELFRLLSTGPMVPRLQRGLEEGQPRLDYRSGVVGEVMPSRRAGTVGERRPSRPFAPDQFKRMASHMPATHSTRAKS